LTHLDRVGHEEFFDKRRYDNRVSMTVNEAFFAVIPRNILAYKYGESNAWHGEFVDVKISFAFTDGCVGQTVDLFSFSHHNRQ